MRTAVNPKPQQRSAYLCHSCTEANLRVGFFYLMIFMRAGYIKVQYTMDMVFIGLEI